MSKIRIVPKPAIFKDALEKSATYKRVFLGEEGRRVLEDIMVGCGWYRSPSVSAQGKQLDAEQARENVGKQNAIRYILENLTTDLERIDL